MVHSSYWLMSFYVEMKRLEKLLYIWITKFLLILSISFMPKLFIPTTFFLIFFLKDQMTRILHDANNLSFFHRRMTLKWAFFSFAKLCKMKAWTRRSLVYLLASPRCYVQKTSNTVCAKNITTTSFANNYSSNRFCPFLFLSFCSFLSALSTDHMLTSSLDISHCSLLILLHGINIIKKCNQLIANEVLYWIGFIQINWWTKLNPLTM